MPEFLDDPSVLTKERLKSELLAHNVELPAGNPPKDVLVRLYLQKLTVHNQPRDPPATLDTFSSDDDLPPPVVTNRSRSSSRKATRKTDQLPPDVSALTDDGLREQLLHLGADVGPVVASTRKLYEKKLQRLLDQGPARVQKLLDQGPARVPLLVLTDLQSNHNGKPDPYSDEEEGGAPEPEPDVEPEPVVGRTARSRGETPVTTRSAQRHTVEKIAASEQSPQVEEEEEEEEVLKELFLNDIISPTGITATCRRPIRGAAGRPVTPGDLWNHDKRLFLPRSSKLSGLAERRAAASPPTSFSASSRLLAAAAPPTAVSKAARRSWLWKKLLLLAVVAGFLFLVYQAMEADSQRPFQGARSLEEGSSA